MHLKRTDYRFGLEHGLQSFANTVVLLPLITVVLEELILTTTSSATHVAGQPNP